MRERLPRERFGPNELQRWLEETQECNERASRSSYIPGHPTLEPSL